MLAELNDLYLDVIQSMVHVQYLNALDFGSVAFRISNGFCGLFTAERCHSSVDFNSSHNGDNTVFLLIAVHIKQLF